MTLGKLLMSEVGQLGALSLARQAIIRGQPLKPKRNGHPTPENPSPFLSFLPSTGRRPFSLSLSSISLCDGKHF